MEVPENDKCLIGMFIELAQDMTPPSAEGDATVLFAPICEDAEILHRCAAILSQSERRSADRFITDTGKNEFIFRRAFRRYCARRATGSECSLSEFVFNETENGRPFLSGSPDIWFSFSACWSGVFGAWSTSHAVGVDIETCAQNVEAAELANHYFSPAEGSWVEQSDATAFFRLWSLKEAALKSIGEGLPFGLHAFKFELDPARMLDAPVDPLFFQVYELAVPGSTAALVTRQRMPESSRRL